MIEVSEKDISMDKIDSNNNSNSNNNSKTARHSSRIAEKYSLRPRTIIKRIQLESRRQENSEKEARKPKQQPLSKYRRKTANARERHRMKEINDAFTTLRGILPSFNVRRHASSGMTKITTLKLATSYIQALSDVLHEVGPPSEIHSIHSSHSMVSQIQENKLNESQQQLCTIQADFFSCHHSSRSSLSSNSEIGDLLSDDSCVFDNNLDAFDDIPAFQEPDPFALLLASDNVDLSIVS